MRLVAIPKPMAPRPRKAIFPDIVLRIKCGGEIILFDFQCRRGDALIEFEIVHGLYMYETILL